MDGFVGFLILLGIGLFAAGPVAMVLAIVLFNKLGGINRRLNKLEGKPEYGSYGAVPAKPMRPVPKPITPTAPTASVQSPPIEVKTPPPVTPSSEVIAATTAYPVPKAQLSAKGGLELKIGTTVAMVIGAILVIVGVGFFLRHIYQAMTFGPAARVSMVAAGGLLAFIIGEVLRRRDYEMVAKGLTALGFALLYAAVFSGSRVYALFSTEWAFGLSIIVTAATMAYAVRLNEVFIAFLALLGGYLSPVIISTGQNLPIPLFSYVFVLSSGAIGCAMFRRWRAVNWIAMVGTYLLYTGWFEKFYTPDQMQTALLWLGVFGGMYLICPILYGLLRKVQAHAEDVGLVVLNSAAVFYYLWQILNADFQHAFALTCAGLGVVHLAMMEVGRVRYKEDSNLQAALGVLGTAFMTVSILLYFNRTQPMVIAWSIETVVLTFIGIRYQNLWTKAMSIIVASIAAIGLFYHLPLHNSVDFHVFVNAPFATWCCVSAAILICHGLWRFLGSSDDEESLFMAQIFYAAGAILLVVGCSLEWYAHCDWHIESRTVGDSNFWLGIIVLCGLAILAFLARPLPPQGQVARCFGVLTAFGGAVWTALVMTDVYHDGFMIFANVPFMIAAFFVGSILLAAWFVRRTDTEREGRFRLPPALVLGALILVWVLLSEQIYQYFWCKNKFVESVENWRFSAQMYMSVAWAVYAAVLVILGFIFRVAGIRYLSLTIFAVLLGKINLDIWDLGTEYRIATFLTTGLILVGVSFLYQFLKKKGFFDAVEK
ncbi:MAG: hypothetical protein B6I25_05685 [Planctomycetales bacterium 4572_13]|nr:MAG: hypothetical protein B6I25_05685 [Planctomycetales bacterium 4572_13]